MNKYLISATGAVMAAVFATTAWGAVTAFTSGTPISSSAMNANFDAINGNLTDGTCTKNAADDVGGMVRVGPLCVDKYEATVTIGTCTANGETNCGSVVAVSDVATAATTGLSWAQAQRACINAGKRLPTAGEWLAAYSARVANGLVAPSIDQFELVDAFAQGTLPGKPQAGFIGLNSLNGNALQLETNQDYDAPLPDVTTFSWRFRCVR
jgi:hypothetical protein